VVWDPEAGWREFIDRHTPTLLSLIERAGIVDRDEAMEIYVRTCTRLSEHDYAALRRRDPSKGSLEGWLAVVVKRTIVDWVRSRAGRRRLFAAIRHLDRLHQRLFELYYWDERRLAEAAQILSAELRTDVSLATVLDALETIDAALTARHRSDLLSLAARSRHASSLDDDQEGAPIIEPAVDAPSPEAMLRAREMEARLEQALTKLPPEDAAIVSLKYGEGLTRPQIQRLLRLPVLTEHRVRTILAALRAHLGEDDAAATARQPASSMTVLPGGRDA
jgi:DNA-directed RNA polymerase specialized sigma24 family protein